ncbi:MAG: hypothetical protein C0601_03515 [Candidatus Muiribacterium halophilum]|uniref:DUF2007 domain-containing protein n=1 Tax=Muiribacterium halophilum TaxID=2053465 RepID=A0A2N5ZJQ9_MUIH1|nr:MAG: hypothetical protein C0601_03515 [Candidatus Muirbacterium halophilum]
MNKKFLTSCSNRIEAELLKGYLESEGVKAFIEADDCGGMAPHLHVLISIKIYVAENELEKAKGLLEDFNIDEEE